MIEYSADELRTLRRYDVTVSRPVRKTIFRLRLWRPVRQRRHNQRQSSRDRCLSTNRRANNQLIVGCLNTQSVSRKSALVCRTIDEANIDVMILTETWHECTGAVSLQKAVPDGFKCIDAARPLPSGTDVNRLLLQNHGGIAIIHRRQIEFHWTCLLRRLRICAAMRQRLVNVFCYFVSIDQEVKQSAQCFLMNSLQCWSNCYC